MGRGMGDRSGKSLEGRYDQNTLYDAHNWIKKKQKEISEWIPAADLLKNVLYNGKPLFF